MKSAGRTAIIVLVVVSLVLSAAARHLAMDHRRQTSVIGGSTGASLSAMNSYALALLLGGLRGPLVMFLWPSAETQKSERNLEDFDTKIEWIRLLQAEFDTVHIFQIWNKAYNISVQMANLGNKYTTILDALDYAQKVDAERPNNINILGAIGQIYFDKLGNSQEKDYYKRRVRTETLPHEMRQKLKENEPGWRRLELDPMLDEHGNILPKYLQPGKLRLTEPRTNEVYDGSALQFLPRFGPYPYGISPFGLGYNYYKRAQLLQEAGKQRHAQLSELVIDSRPALSLKNWSEDAWKSARRAEIAACGEPVPADDEHLDKPTQDLPLNHKFPDTAMPLVRQAIFEYDQAVRLADGAEAEYVRHVSRYPTNLVLYQQHRDTVAIAKQMSIGDGNYLAAIVATDPAEKKRLCDASAAGYEAAIDLNHQVILRYYVAPDLVAKLFPPGFTRDRLPELSPAQRSQIVASLLQMMKQGANEENAEDMAEHVRYILRAEARLKQLGR